MEIANSFATWQYLRLRTTRDWIQSHIPQLNREAWKEKFHFPFYSIVIFSFFSWLFPQEHPLVPGREVQLAFPHVTCKGHTCETPVSLKEENASLAVLQSRFFHLQAGAVSSSRKKNLILKGDRYVQTTYRGQNFWLIRRPALLSKPRGSSSPCKSSASQTQLARGRAALAKLALLLQDPKRKPQLLCQSAVNST